MAQKNLKEEKYSRNDIISFRIEVQNVVFIEVSYSKLNDSSIALEYLEFGLFMDDAIRRSFFGYSRIIIGKDINKLQITHEWL